APDLLQCEHLAELLEGLAILLLVEVGLALGEVAADLGVGGGGGRRGRSGRARRSGSRCPRLSAEQPQREEASKQRASSITSHPLPRSGYAPPHHGDPPCHVHSTEFAEVVAGGGNCKTAPRRCGRGAAGVPAATIGEHCLVLTSLAAVRRGKGRAVRN